MSEHASVSVWIQQLRDGDARAAQKIWEGYFHRLVGLARVKLRALPKRHADEEDVALSAFDSFFRGVEQGRFPQLDDRDDLWQILLMITERKAIDLAQHEGRQKRDWRRLQATSGTDSAASSGLSALEGHEPDPAFATEVAEQCEQLLRLLADDDLRTIAIRKMEGFTNEEIAAELGCSLATVERRLRLIRREWTGSE
jgi:DNA-directed RNA polymerase specialized sigma24 family protein